MRRSTAWLALALALGACDDDAARPTGTLAATDSADGLMTGMTTRLMAGWRDRNLVDADTTWIYENSQTFELAGVTVRFYGSDGRETAALTSRAGTYRWQLKTFEARGDVRVEFADGRLLTSEVLRYDENAQEISTDQPFIFRRPDGVIRGQGFTSDPDMRQIELDRPTGESFDGGMELPGQGP